MTSVLFKHFTEASSLRATQTCLIVTITRTSHVRVSASPEAVVDFGQLNLDGSGISLPFFFFLGGGDNLRNPPSNDNDYNIPHFTPRTDIVMMIYCI